MASKLMNRIQVENCIFDQLGINASNISKFERILELPYEIYIEVVNRMCNGELTLDDFDQRIFSTEASLDRSVFLDELDTSKISKSNIGIADNLEKDFKIRTKLSDTALRSGGVYTNPIYEAKSSFTGSSKNDLIIANSIAKLNKTLLPGLNDIIVKKKNEDELKENISKELSINSSLTADMLLNGRNSKFALDTPEIKQVRSEKGLIKRQIAELKRRNEFGDTTANLAQANDKLELVNKRLNNLITKRNNENNL